MNCEAYSAASTERGTAKSRVYSAPFTVPKISGMMSEPRFGSVGAVDTAQRYSAGDLNKGMDHPE